MKKQILKNSIRTIKNSFPRFLSLLIMSLLGVFAFAGLQATAPDMIDSLDNHLDSCNTYDIKVFSPLGVTNKDIEKIKQIEGVKDICGSYTNSYSIEIDNEDIVISISTIDSNINTLILKEGRLPNHNEIVVEENFLTKTSAKLNDKIMIFDKEFTISGTVDSTLYFNYVGLNQNRGTTSIGSGIINYYSFINYEDFEKDYYSEIYVTVNDALEQETSSKKYNKLIKDVKEKISLIKNDLEINRYNDICLQMNTEYEIAKELLDETLITLNNKKTVLENRLNQINITKQSLYEQLSLLGITKSEISAYIDEKITLRNSFPIDSENYININNEIVELTSLKNNIVLLETNEDEYNRNKQSLDEAFINYNTQKDTLELKKQQSTSYLNNLDKHSYSINDRLNDKTYQGFIDDTNSIRNLSLIFPVVFFGVAVLISLISMNRLVEYDRNEIGTLKSLGFSNMQIIFKYLLFSSIATILGSFIGSALGIIIIPKMIYGIYSILFSLPKFYLGLNLKTTLLGFAISILCVCGSTLFTVCKVLKERPSDLMRPKAPKPGKRILLERVSFFWKHLKFSKKITIRNLFRYKKRGIITIIGITSCTALMLCGFGIKDSIADIPTHQYGEVFKFDGMAYLNGSYKEETFSDEVFTSTTAIENVYAKVDLYDVNIFISKDSTELEKVVNLENNKLLENKVIITNKLASILKLNIGDTIQIKDSNNKKFELEISSIIHNYLEHYIFIGQNTWENNDEDFKPNVIYFNTIELNEEEKSSLASSLLENGEIVNVSFVSTLIDNANNMLKSLDKVVIILIVLASLLSFVVLYNLSNININERKRELATLKVLGFYPNEVDGYITRENIILTIIGIIFGLIVGYFLTNIVISTVEIEKAKFIRYIKPLSYLYSAIITIFFTLIVNFFTHFSLKNIDMIDSLKSVE